MENIMVKLKLPFSSSLAEILILVTLEIVNVLKDLFSRLRYVLKHFLHFLTSHLCDEFESGVDDDQKKQEVKTKCGGQVVQTKRSNLPEELDQRDKKKLCIEEVKDVMERLLAEKNLCDDELFEEEVSLEEVREAFDVFDENRDGFIDAGEVRRVLRALVSMETSENDCKSMIRAFDKNGDGIIDFKEFVKIMEDSFR